MKTAMTARWLAFAGTVIAVASAVPAQAQFGGVVFDPTQSAHAIKQLVNETEQIAQGSQENMTLAQQLAQDIQIAGTALQQYNTLMMTYNTITNNVKHFSSKSIWQTAENALIASSVQNQYGETSGLQGTLNGQPQNAGMAWKIMNLALAGTSSSFWQNQVVGASQNLTRLAHMEALDASSTQCLAAVGTYNAGRQTNLPANRALQTSQYDTTSFTNSELEQLNLLNVSEAQRIHEAQSQGQLQACLAQQAAIANMEQRNQASTALNDAAYAYQQQRMNPTYAGNESQTWTTYY